MALSLVVNGNSVPVKIIKFSDGASSLYINPELMPEVIKQYSVTVDPLTKINDIYAELKHFIDVMERDWPGVESRHLCLTYLPDGRADRSFGKGYAVPMQVFINDMFFRFTQVTIFDPHNPEALLDSVSRMLPIMGQHRIPKINIISQASLFYETFKYQMADSIGKDDHIYLISPDQGAELKTTTSKDVLINHGYDATVVKFEKRRNVHTGAIESIDFVHKASFESEYKRLDEMGVKCHFIVIDDICDGGGTFVGIAGKLKNLTFAPISLYVTHGIFSKGLEPLDAFDRVYAHHVVSNYVTNDDLLNFNNRNKITINDN